MLLMIPFDYIPPPGWWPRHHAPAPFSQTYERCYSHLSGAKVTLNRFGTWSWWKPHAHHINNVPCETLGEALEKALEGWEP
jgi:hypothetical protein